MKIAYILYDGITTLDFIGVYDPISRLRSMGFLPDLRWDICALTATIKDHFGLTIVADRVAPDLVTYDAIILPGGFGTRELSRSEPFLNWLKTADQVELKISICTGSLLFGAAGWVKGKIATTHFDHYAELEQFGATVKEARIIANGGLITAGAVASSLDLGLFLCEKWAGEEARESIQRRMHYRKGATS